MTGARVLASLAGVACLLAATVLTVPSATAQAMVRAEDHTIGSFDGTPLAATLWFDASAPDEPRPVVLAAHGWAQDRHVMEGTAHWLVAAGYHVLGWDARGFGESGGTVGLNGPQEWADVSAIVDWLADERNLPQGPRFVMDATGDPRVGMVGASYGGAIQLLAAAQDPRIDAVVPDITWNDLAQSLAPGGVVKRGWLDLLFFSGFAASHGFMQEAPWPNTGGMDDRLAVWYAEATATGRLPADAVGPLAERSPATHLDTVVAHVLITHGWWDTLFPPEEAALTYLALRDRVDAQTHLLYHPGGHGHVLTEEARGSYREQVARFLAGHLLGAEVDPLPPVTVFEPGAGNWTHLDAWPPVPVHTTDVPLDAGAGAVRTLAVLPAPTSHTDVQQFAGDLPAPQADLLDSGPLPTATYLDTSLVGPLTLLGDVELGLTVTPRTDDVTLFFSLVETGDPLKVVHNQVTPVRLEAKGDEAVRIGLALSPLAYTVTGAGGLALRVATSDTGYHGARVPGTVDVHLDDASLRLPLAAPPGVTVRESAAPEGRGEAVPGPPLLAFALGGLAAVAWSRRKKGRLT